MDDPLEFMETHSRLKLRRYQQQVARAVLDSVLNQRGLTLVVMFPRQSGKNELQAQIETYLLYQLRETQAELVKISPTWKPQSLNAMRRLERVLAANPLTRGEWKKESGYLYRLGQARMYFFSGAVEANIVGATASTLLEVDEAQDVQIDKFDRDISPMTASTNATRVLWGTAWTSRTLLARELRAARESEQRDGLPRAFVLTADTVAAEVEAYGRFVAGQVARLGRQHPMIKTQYFSEEIDSQAGMFPPGRVQRMLAHAAPETLRPLPARGPFVILIDVAGEDEGARALLSGASADPAALANPRRDATALTLAQVDLSTLADPLLRAPTYRPLLRRDWVGVRHADLHGAIRALAQDFQARYIVIDATGVGAGLSSFLKSVLGDQRVIDFTFNQKTKSELGWSFLNVVDEGRWLEVERGQALAALAQAAPLPAPTLDPTQTPAFLRQLSFCEYEVLSGPGKVMRWGVPDGARDPVSGAWVHDDWLISAALCAVLDKRDWSVTTASKEHAGVVRAKDPLADMQGF